MTLGGTIMQAYQKKVADRTIRWDYQVGLPFGCKSGGIRWDYQVRLPLGENKDIRLDYQAGLPRESSWQDYQVGLSGRVTFWM